MCLMKNKLLPVLASILLLFSPSSAFASYLYLSPQTASLNKNDTLTVEVRLNTEKEQINAVSADIVYPQDKLEVISSAGGDFPILAENSYGNGKVNMSEGAISPLSGDVLVARLVFKALNNGTANINFTSGSHAVRASDSSDSLNLSKSSGALLNILEQTAVYSSPISTYKSTPSLKPSATPQSTTTDQYKIDTCISQEENIKTDMLNIIDLSNLIVSKFDKISNLTNDFYTTKLIPQGKTLSNYNDLYQAVSDKRALAILSVQKAQKDVNSFSCQSKTIKDNLNNFKNDIQTAKQSIVDYQSALKVLVSALINNTK